MPSSLSPSRVLALVTGGLAGLGCLQAAIGAVLAHRFARMLSPVGDAASPRPPRIGSVEAPPSLLPPVTLLKPLHGAEPLLEEALATALDQDYPNFQVVFGVQDPADPAIAVVNRLRERFPRCDLSLVIDQARHGTNRKIDNLINMLPSARHDVLVISDSDIHAAPDYLRQVVGALHQPNTGLVTTLYGARAATPGLAQRLAAAQINHAFLPGVLMSRRLGRQDCLGATMALRRSTLDEIGGLAALSPHIADDSTLGKLVRATGREIAVADTLVLTTVSDAGLRELFRHELRWGRTIRSVEPVGYAASSLQLPLFWASLCVAFAPLLPASWLTFAATLAVRGAVARRLDRITASPSPLPLPLLPLRDWFSAAVMLGSFTGRRVAWRGHTLHLPSRPASATTRITEPVDTLPGGSTRRSVAGAG